MEKSDNSYDWLGTGFYFWENNNERAMAFAREIQESPQNKTQKVQNPAVLGAIIDLGFCLDLLDSKNIEFIKIAFEMLKRTGLDLPKNTHEDGSGMPLRRRLDRAVIEYLHQMRDQDPSTLPQFDSVRAVFIEGKAAYPNSGFHDKSHIQICIRNPNCIKGFFHPRDLENGFEKV